MTRVARAMQRRRSEPKPGFTLVELMVVVAIIGVLAAVAAPVFTGYVYQARAAEAPAFLGEIRQRQEAYRSEFGLYAAAPVVGDSFSAYTPALGPDSSAYVWPDDVAEWNQLGAQPDGSVRFHYATVSGPPASYPFAANPDFWYIARAVGDLDGRGDTVQFEAYSHTSAISCNSPRGWD